MSDIAIRVDNLSKLYHLGAVHQRPDTLRDALTGFLPRISRKGKKIRLIRLIRGKSPKKIRGKPSTPTISGR